MGYTAIVRWTNADANAAARVEQNLRVNHNGVNVGKWHMSIKSYRSTFGRDLNNLEAPSHTIAGSERTLNAVTMGDTVYVLLEDPLAPLRTEEAPPGFSHPYTHYRSTYITVKPPGNLEQLLVQLKASWLPVRQATGGQSRNKSVAANALMASAELAISGGIYQVGSDWIVRVGLVQSKDQVRGLVLEAEYLPVPTITPVKLEGSDFMSQFLSSLVPNNNPDNIIGVVNIGNAVWGEVLYKEKGKDEGKKKKTTGAQQNSATGKQDDDDDVYAYDMEGVEFEGNEGDWTGLERERRSVYIILGALKADMVL